MKILSRYLLRLHLAPFLFALAALTLIMLLDQLGDQFGQLMGKGLEWTVIAEVFLYSIPFIVAMTLPMAVLIAVLYTFNRLASDNEITAMKANGLNLPRLLIPLLLAAFFLAGGMVWFQNSILPESNHRLQVLLSSIGRKKPTFVLQERTINEVVSEQLYLQTARIDRAASGLEEVVIYDERAPERSRTIYSDAGRMAYSADQTDLFLTLSDGVLQESKEDEPELYQRMHFDELVMRVPDVADQLERSELGGRRDDRTMPIGQMWSVVAEARARAAENAEASRRYATALTETLLGGAAGGAPGTDEGSDASGAPEANGAPDTDGAPDANGASDADDAPDANGAADADDAPDASGAAEEARRVRSLQSAESQFSTYGTRSRSAARRAAQYEVEIHKKWSIPAACIVFVLIGAPLAIRYREGGVAMVVFVSFGFFCAYYVALVAGEELGDNLILHPFWAMWAPNILFGAIGLGLLWRAVKVG